MTFRITDPSLSPSAALTQRQAKVAEWVGEAHSAQAVMQPEVMGTLPIDQISQKNCENLIGAVAIPVGIAGPVLVGSFGDGLNDGGGELSPGGTRAAEREELAIPLATTEGALVASVSRGCKALSMAGGVDVVVKKIGMSRAPVFKCQSGREALRFTAWLEDQLPNWQDWTAATSNHLALTGLQTWVRGKYVFARYVFDTQEAMGMNMVTIALTHAWDRCQNDAAFETAGFKDQVSMLSISSNVCSDKKESQINRLLGRGYWVQAESVVSDEVVRDILKTTPEALVEAHHAKNIVGTSVAGSLSQNMQAANVIAALFAATGQDLAHVVEGAQASVQFERVDGGVYAAVTLPNICVGSVGGGTGLPAQSAARSLIRSQGKPVTAIHLATAVGAAVLAGEVSGLAALASHDLACAHLTYGRGEVGKTSKASLALKQSHS